MSSERQKTQRSTSRRISSPVHKADRPSEQDVSQETSPDRFDVQQAGHGWLHVEWNISPRALERACSTMGHAASKATLSLRLLRIEQDESRPRSIELVESLPIPSSASEWFLRLPEPRGAWSVELGFHFGKDRFFSLLHCAPVQVTPRADQGESSSPFLAASDILPLRTGSVLPTLDVQSSLFLTGRTLPQARLTVDDALVPVDPHGEFRWSTPLSNGRRVFPILVAHQGQLQRALLAIEFNLHVLPSEHVEDD